MKNLSLIVLALILLMACNQKKTKESKSIQQPKTVPEINEKISESYNITSKEIKTKTGKIFIINENHFSSGISNLSINTKGFTEVNNTIHIEESDPISNTYISDLNKDGFDELYIITKSTGSGSYGTIYGFSSNKDKSATPIAVPEIAQSDLASDAVFNGYMGHDSIYVSNNKLFRKFPIYKDDDKNCCPTGGNKIIQYSLKKGEASWILEMKN